MPYHAGSHDVIRPMMPAVRKPQRWRRWRRYLASALLLHLTFGGSLYLGVAWLHDSAGRLQQPVAVFELVAPPLPAAAAAPAANEAATAVEQAPAAPRSLAVLATEVPESDAADMPLPDTRQAARAEAVVDEPQTSADAAPVPSGGADAGGAAGGVQAAALEAAQNWEHLLLLHLDRHKRYPAWAERLGQEAVVRVQVRVDRSGEVLERRIVGGRGYRLLDEEALALLARASPLPPPPPELPARDLEFTVPIDFFIDRRLTQVW